MTAQVLALIVFFLTYIFIVIFYGARTYIVWSAVAVLVILGVVSPRGAILSIDWNVIFLYIGMLFVSEAFLYSRMPDYLASRLVRRFHRTGTAMLALCLLTGFLSMALENVAVVLLMAPIALSIARQCAVSPGPLFVGMAVSSNLQGAATLIGDPPSMLLAGFVGMGFNDFFFIDGRPSIFFCVQAGAVASAVVLWLTFRQHRMPLPSLQRTSIGSFFPSVIVALLIVSLILASSFLHSIPIASGLICLVFGTIAAAWYLATRMRTSRSAESPGPASSAVQTLLKLDWQTAAFLIGVFVLVGSLTANGVMESVAHAILRLAGSSPPLLFMIIVGVSVIVSAFVDNVPFLVAMLPVLQAITATSTLSPYLLYFGLLLGASVGGNITPIGASGNIVAMGIVKREGSPVQFLQFVRIGLPFTVAAVAASTGLLWAVFS